MTHPHCNWIHTNRHCLKLTRLYMSIVCEQLITKDTIDPLEIAQQAWGKRETQHGRMICLWCALIETLTHFDLPTALSPRQMTLIEM